MKGRASLTIFSEWSIKRLRKNKVTADDNGRSPTTANNVYKNIAGAQCCIVVFVS
jgi:hypothetical protein